MNRTVNFLMASVLLLAGICNAAAVHRPTQALQEIRNKLQSVVKNLQLITDSIDSIVATLENISGDQSAPPKAKGSRRKHSRRA